MVSLVLQAHPAYDPPGEKNSGKLKYSLRGAPVESETKGIY